VRFVGSFVGSVLLLAACGDERVEVRVWMYEHATVYRIYQLDSDFLDNATPVVGLCGSINDVRSPDDDYGLPDTCIDGARIERDGEAIATTKNVFTEGPAGAALYGDFSGGEIVLEGCEREVRVSLPSSYPPAPIISAALQEGATMRVNWSVAPATDLVRVEVGSLAGSWCVVAPTETTISLYGYSRAAVTAIVRTPVVHADFGNVQTYAARGAEATTQSRSAIALRRE
jgi:hypothetical protein